MLCCAFLRFPPKQQIGPARPMLGSCDDSVDSVAALCQRFNSLMAAFDSAPWTLQRLCEVLLEPHKQYKRLHKLVSGAVTCCVYGVQSSSSQFACVGESFVYHWFLDTHVKWALVGLLETPSVTPPLHPSPPHHPTTPTQPVPAWCAEMFNTAPAGPYASAQILLLWPAIPGPLTTCLEIQPQ